jgi:hypothetical protein
MVVHTVGIELDDLFVLIDGQLQNVVGAGTAGHIAQRAEINATEQLVGFKVLGVALDDVLRFADRVGNTSSLDVELGKGGSQEFRGRIRFDRESVFFAGFHGQVAAAVSGHHLLVHVGQRVVIVRGSLIHLAGRGLRGLRIRLAGFGGRRVGLTYTGLTQGGGGRQDHQTKAKEIIHPGPDCACGAFPKPQLIWMQSRRGKGAFILPR